MKNKNGRDTNELKDTLLKARVSKSYKRKVIEFIKDLNDDNINSITDIITTSLNEYMERNKRSGKTIFILGNVKSLLSIDCDKNTFKIQDRYGEILTIDTGVELGELKQFKNEDGYATYKFKNKNGEIYKLDFEEENIYFYKRG